MKPFVILFILFLAFNARAQTPKLIRLDSSVSVRVPFEPERIDTAGDQKIIFGKAVFGSFQIVVVPDNPRVTPDIEKKKHLLNYYDTYIKKIRISSKGRISAEADTMIGDLHAKAFTLQVDSGTGKQFRDFRILHENCATYIFQFLYTNFQEEYSKEERDKFFNSIHVANDPALSSQFTAKTIGKKPGRSEIWLLSGAAGGILVALAVIISLVRRKKRNKSGQ